MPLRVGCNVLVLARRGARGYSGLPPPPRPAPRTYPLRPTHPELPLQHKDAPTILDRVPALQVADAEPLESQFGENFTLNID